jgi:hypothetical protein
MLRLTRRLSRQQRFILTYLWRARLSGGVQLKELVARVLSLPLNRDGERAIIFDDERVPTGAWTKVPSERSSLSRAVRRLEARGLVTHGAATGDRPPKAIRLTRDGKAIARAIAANRPVSAWSVKRNG